MRQWIDVVDYRPMAVGTIGINAGTTISTSVDTFGFTDIYGIITYAAVGGTATAAATVDFKFQQGDSVNGTGSDFADITDGDVMGSMKVTSQTITAPTAPQLASTTFYERLKNDTRKRYLRCIATHTGTSGAEIAYTVGVVLGRPNDTLYIANGTTFGTNTETTVMQI